MGSFNPQTFCPECESAEKRCAVCGRLDGYQTGENKMKCSFCSKLDKEVKLIVAANNKVGICDECIIDSLKLLIYGERPIKINLDKEEKEERHGSFLGIND